MMFGLYIKRSALINRRILHDMPAFRSSYLAPIIAIAVAILYSRTQLTADSNMAIPALDTPCSMVHTSMYETKKVGSYHSFPFKF
jgi:hypothetical protein